MVSSVLHCILDCELCELHFCTMRLYCKHDFILQKLTSSDIRAFAFFIAIMKPCFGVFVNVIVKIW